jgi:hypothetical protein
MENAADKMRQTIAELASNLNPRSIALIPTTRDLFAIVDKRFAKEVQSKRWYATTSRGDHVHAVADILGHRISLQRFVMKLQFPDCTYDELKQISFENKVTFDCRVENLQGLVGRKAVMRNRRPKRNTSSQFKGVVKFVAKDGSIRWRTAIKGDHGSLAIGVYDDEIWAAKVYDAAAFLLFEGAAFLNFPNKSPDLDALAIARIKISRSQSRKKSAEKTQQP